MPGAWDQPADVLQMEEQPKYQICKKHFVDGKSWEEAGAYKHMQELIKKKQAKVDGCETYSDIVKRYKKLDHLYEKLKAGDTFKCYRDIQGRGINRNLNGVYIHFDRNCNPIFGGGGYHRLAIAKILNLNTIPCQLGVVHKKAILSGKFKNFSKLGNSY